MPDGDISFPGITPTITVQLVQEKANLVINYMPFVDKQAEAALSMLRKKVWSFSEAVENPLGQTDVIKLPDGVLKHYRRLCIILRRGSLLINNPNPSFEECQYLIFALDDDIRYIVHMHNEIEHFKQPSQRDECVLAISGPSQR